MKIGVVGLWHLGCVTATCLADLGHQVLGYDHDANTIKNLQANQAPIFEPGLNELIKKNAENNRIHFSDRLSDLNNCEIIWVTFDTPVDDNDHADVDYVINQVKAVIEHAKTGALFLISSQIPVGSTRALFEFAQKHFPEKKLSFAYSPENLRLGKAIEIFTKPDRIIVGYETEADKNRIAKMLEVIQSPVIWMSIESAEMTKHALNAFLATSVVFINEIASLCEQVGANAREVEQGLKSEIRIGPKAYLRPGGAFAGGTLARDVSYLTQIGEKKKINTELFSAVLTSNINHRKWATRRVKDILGNLNNKIICVLGLTYKPDTDTLRRSNSVELCKHLHQDGAKIVAFDPLLKNLPSDLATKIDLKANYQDALKNADAVIISTECPEFLKLTTDDLVSQVKTPYILDANGYLEKNLARDERVHYFTVGSSL